jgi:hypothetical protein
VDTDGPIDRLSDILVIDLIILKAGNRADDGHFLSELECVNRHGGFNFKAQTSAFHNQNPSGYALCLACGLTDFANETDRVCPTARSLNSLINKG